MNVKQAIQSLQEMIDTGVINGEESFGVFTNGGETFLSIDRFKIKISYEPNRLPVVHPVFLFNFI